MLQIIDLKEIEDCLDADNQKEIIFNKIITKEDVIELSKNVELEYYNFTRPLYKIIFKPNFYIKGVVGFDTAKLYFLNNNTLSVFNQFFNTNF